MMTIQNKILGDFQTPLALAKQVITTLEAAGYRWERILEPTCGTGAFIQAAIQAQQSPSEIIGIEIQAVYTVQAETISAPQTNIQILHKDIFTLDLKRDLVWQTQGKLLITGNLPWVTNAEQGALGGSNLPTKSNFKGYKGLDALTGKSNFDIAEFIWIKLFHEFKDEPVTLALLCKTSTARSVLSYAHKARLSISDARLYSINSQKWFNAAVDACLFVLDLNITSPNYEAHIFESLDSKAVASTLHFSGNVLVADNNAYTDLQFINGRSPIEWRQGIKHDAASVMELIFENKVWKNKLGIEVNIEEEYIYPLLKTADVKEGKLNSIQRGVIIPQKQIGQNTSHLQFSAPRLWDYLNQYTAIFEQRQSSIYKGKPPFSIFGVGDYSFAPYKVVVSGFYKYAYFVPVFAINGKPVFCDDTCYLLPCESVIEALTITAALNHPIAQRFIKSLTFQDAKRPITKALLSRIDLNELITYLPFDELLDGIKNRSNSVMSLPASKDEMTASLSWTNYHTPLLL